MPRHAIPRHRQGFTLIELLTVIAIIGILAAILIPVVGRVRESAGRARCASNMRQVSLSMLLYADGNRGWFPWVTGQNVTPVGTTRTWAQALADTGLLPKNDIFACPSDRVTIEGETSRVPARVPLSYQPVNPALVPRQNITLRRKLATIDRPSQVYMLTEWHGLHDGAAPGGAWTHHLGEGSSAARDLIADEARSRRTTQHNAQGGRNYAFMDGHVEFRDRAAALTDWAWGPVE